MNDLATTPVAICQLREGDAFSFASGFPAETIVAVAEYHPVGGCVSFRMGYRGADGETVLMPRSGWGWRNPGVYSWGDCVYMTQEDATVANARNDLFREAYPDYGAA